MKKSGLLSVMATLASVMLLSTTGCNNADDGMSKAQITKAEKLDTIAKQSDGNWDKVSQADRDYVLQNFASGNEQTAKMILLGKAGKLGGPPRKGGPGGGPPGQ